MEFESQASLHQLGLEYFGRCPVAQYCLKDNSVLFQYPVDLLDVSSIILLVLVMKCILTSDITIQLIRSSTKRVATISTLTRIIQDKVLHHISNLPSAKLEGICVNFFKTFRIDLIV